MSDLVEERSHGTERGELYAMPRREWTLIDLLSIFRRRRRIIAGFVVAALLVAGLFCALATPRYKATGQVEVEKDAPGTLGLDHAITGDDSGAGNSALDASMTMQTNARLLQSSTLALMVIKQLHLETTADYFPQHRSGWQLPHWFFFWKKPVEPMSVPLEDAPNRRAAVLRIFIGHLKVNPLTGTRLIDVSYSSPDPRLAAAVVNRLISALQEYTFQSRFEEASQASTWLAAQLSSLKKQTEQLQQTANQLEQGTGIYGGDAAHNLVLARLDQLNTALEAAEQNRILKQSIDQVAKSGDPDLISGLAGNATAGATPAMSNSLALLQTLRGEQARAQAQIDQDSARYGSAYPMMAELHGRLDGINKAIHAEIERIGERAHTDYEIAQREEDSARADLEKQKQLAKQTNNRAVAYELARQDADGSRALYQGLLNKLKEAGVLEGLRSTNLSIAAVALVPPTNHPRSPDVPLYFSVALCGGLFFGCAGALVREATDASVRSVDDLERMLGVSLAGMLPKYPDARQFPWMRRRPGIIESITASEGKKSGEGVAPLYGRSFPLPLRRESSQAILVTSAVPGDGKSHLAASLAVSLARSGAKVLLVDADLLCPSQHLLFATEPGVKEKRGLADALMPGGMAEALECAQPPGLSLVWAGLRATESVDLLVSPRMEKLMQKWRAQYDFVLLDSAPVLPVPDAASLARLCDRTLLVVRYESTTMQAAQRSYRMIRRNMPDQAALEIIMNGVPENSPDYFSYYGYKQQTYAGGIHGHA
ncbi:MAG TPA: Wzz/FepE/Etk N-terminal domain-containing protein [Acidobacteriaceae bacterium]|nr:Wzz/FepE/Etk N-terminal domain-containing protein [Acidobacteriaceae bacterium]